MAGNLRQIGSADGKVRVKTNGPVVAGASDPCCCSDPCSSCAGTQNGASGVVSGSCSGGSCSSAGGTYGYINFSSTSTYCRWVWDRAAHNIVFLLFFCKATSKWYASIYNVGNSAGSPLYGSATTQCSFEPGLDVTSSVSCDSGTGLISASFALPGLNAGGGDCTGCTATITI
jgi:hypothetical protein